MKKIICLMSIISLLSFAGRSEVIEIELWPDGAPESNGLTGPEGKSGVSVTNISRPMLYVYPAENPNGTALLMCPGGGYSVLAINHEGFDMADWFNSLGITYAVLKYRMPNGHDQIPLSDAEQAMRILRERSSEWGVNPQSIGIGGASAGGHLASTLATHYSSPETRPDFQVLFYPVITADSTVTHLGSIYSLCGPEPTDEQLALYSNELHITPQTPPAFIMLSADDSGVPPANSLRYFDGLTRNGVRSSIHIYPSGGHGWGYSDWFPYKRLWKLELEEWLKREVVKDSAQSTTPQ